MEQNMKRLKAIGMHDKRSQEEKGTSEIQRSSLMFKFLLDFLVG